MADLAVENVTHSSAGGEKRRKKKKRALSFVVPDEHKEVCEPA